MIEEIFDQEKHAELEQEQKRAAEELELQLQKLRERIDAQITQYFVTSDGVFLGAYSKNNPAIPEGAIEVEAPPSHGILEIWDFEKKQWVDNVLKKIIYLKEDLIRVRKNYLKKTSDYYYPDFPEEILLKRAKARNDILEIENSKELKQIEHFSKNF